MFKNIANQKVIFFAFDSTTNLPKTGDAANLTAYVSKDFGSATILADTSATEISSTNAAGYYLFDLAQAETSADTLLFTGKSSTSNIVVTAVPATVFTRPPEFGNLLIANGAVQANLVQILGTALTETAGQIAAAFKQFFNIASPTSTMNLISNVITTTTATNLTNAPTVGDFTATMKTSIGTATSTAITANGSIIAIKAKTDNLPAAPAAIGDAMTLTAAYNAAKTASQAGDAMALTAGERTTLTSSIWNALTSGFATVGSIGKLLLDNIDAAISSRLASGSYTAPDNATIALIDAKTSNLPADPADASDIAAAFTVIGNLIDAKIPSNLVMTAGKVWALDGDGNALPAKIDVDAIKERTDNLPDAPASIGDIPTATENADALLDRNMATGTDSGGRTPRNALRAIRNKFSTTAHAGEVTYYKEDDTTEAWRAVVTSNPSADPITGSDPV